MFSGYTAWFSKSVQEAKKTLWLKNGGGEETFEKADYIFSEDADCEDTAHVFESEAYLDEHLSVFHPAYITSCVKHQSMNKVSVGKYFFPPTEVQTFIKKQGRQLGWEGSDDGIDYNNQDIFNEDSRETQNRERQRTTTSNQHTFATGDQTIATANKNLSLSPKPGPSNHNPSKPADIQYNREKQVANKTLADNYRRSDRHKQTNVLSSKEAKRNSKEVVQDGVNLGVSMRKKSKMDDKSEKQHYNVQINGIVESVNINKNNQLTKRTNKWKGFDVLKIKDLNKIMGDFVTFQIGVGGCEMINLDEK